MLQQLSAFVTIFEHIAYPESTDKISAMRSQFSIALKLLGTFVNH